jgi:hypothetical protein
LRSLSKSLCWYSVGAYTFSPQDFPASPVVSSQKNRAQKQKSHRQYGSGGGILKLPGL